MKIGRKSFITVSCLVVMLFAGCEKSALSGAGPTAAPQPSTQLTRKDETILQLHWLGKKRIAADTNATNFMAIWNLPESARLETQTLDKLSIAPWRLLPGETAISNAPTALLRPLLEDVVREESYIEIQCAANQSAEIVFAIRLKDARTNLWTTNLASALESLTGIRARPLAGGPGWTLKKHDVPDLVELTCAGDWLLVGAATQTNTLLADFRDRIARRHTPCVQSEKKPWLEAVLDLPRVAEVFSAGGKLPEYTPHITVTVTGEGGKVRTAGGLKFPKPLPLEFEPWNIPTNLIDSSFTGFTAVRGVRPWLVSLESSNRLFAGVPPNQIFAWSFYGAPAQAWFAAPNDATNQLDHLGARLMEMFNPPLAETDFGAVGWLDGAVRWLNMPLLPAFVRTAETNDRTFILAGTLYNPTVFSPPPQQLLQTITSRTNLVCYDWEITSQRVFTWLYIGQVLRMVSNKPQLSSNSASILWLKALESGLGDCTTVVSRTDPATLGFSRISSIGLTALELNLLADWLESPQFPRGLHTFLAPLGTSPGANSLQP